MSTSQPSNPRVYSARWVFPVDRPPLADGTVTVAGSTITAVDPYGVKSPDCHLGNIALTPGLVNPHTHLDLSGARGRLTPEPGQPFPDWLSRVIQYRLSRTVEQVEADIQAGLAEAIGYGTTLLGDISSGGASWASLASAPIRSIVFYEILGLTAERYQHSRERLRQWLDTIRPLPHCQPGVSPHAPYSVAAAAFADSARLGLPVAVHLAESQAEMELLAEHAGPFQDFLERLQLWHPEQLIGDVGRIVADLATANQALLIHGNYLPPDTTVTPNQTVVYCPRTHAAFGHTPHPFGHFQRRAARVCLATDSLASNPDLDPLAEARFVSANRPDIPAELLLKMVTLYGAEALGLADRVGSLTPGKSADMVAISLPDLDHPDPYELLFNAPDPPNDRRTTMINGEWLNAAEV